MIALGSNLPPRREHLQAGVELLTELGSVRAVSSIFESASVGDGEHPDFLNAVVLLETGLDPEPLLERLLAGETAHGRVRTVPGEPRTLDMDLLFHGAERRDVPGLTLPHPRWNERSFVLAPLAEVAGEWRDPVTGRAVSGIWDAARDELPPVRRVPQRLRIPGDPSSPRTGLQP